MARPFSSGLRLARHLVAPAQRLGLLGELHIRLLQLGAPGRDAPQRAVHTTHEGRRHQRTGAFGQKAHGPPLRRGAACR